MILNYFAYLVVGFFIGCLIHWNGFSCISQFCLKLNQQSAYTKYWSDCNSSIAVMIFSHNQVKCFKTPLVIPLKVSLWLCWILATESSSPLCKAILQEFKSTMIIASIYWVSPRLFFLVIYNLHHSSAKQMLWIMNPITARVKQAQGS